MKKTFQKYLPLIALAAGFISALTVAGVHSILFAFLPLLAFVFGYFSSWRWGLLSGFLLFLGCTMTTAIMWRNDLINVIYPLQYFYAFIFGGFSLLLIGALAPVVRRGIRKFGSIAVLVGLLAVISWCSFQAWPAYSYYYQVIVHISEDVENLELFIPLGHVDEEIYRELYDHPLRVPGHLTGNYTKELVETEHGRMLKLTIPELMSGGPRDYPYTVNIIFEMENPPHKLLHLMPRYDVTLLGTVNNQKFIGPVKVRESLTIEEYKVPIKIEADKTVQIELRLENRTGRGEMINFAYAKSNTYTELTRYEGTSSDEWLLVPVGVTDRLRIRGVGD